MQIPFSNPVPETFKSINQFTYNDANKNVSVFLWKTDLQVDQSSISKGPQFDKSKFPYICKKSF